MGNGWGKPLFFVQVFVSHNVQTIRSNARALVVTLRSVPKDTNSKAYPSPRTSKVIALTTLLIKLYSSVLGCDIDRTAQDMAGTAPSGFGPGDHPRKQMLERGSKIYVRFLLSL